MTIKELRILPPLSFARLGSASEPLDNYTVEENPEHPLGFRRLKGAETLIVDEKTGEIGGTRTPDDLTFKEGKRIRPVAPFLEVFAVTENDELVPLTTGLLTKHKLGTTDVSWRVSVANRKVVRRTGDPNDLVSADVDWFSSHDAQTLKGHCNNFISGSSFIDFGHVRFIKPNRAHPEIRLRFMPAKGLIYGPAPAKEKATKGPRKSGATKKQQGLIPSERAIYDRSKGRWVGFPPHPTHDHSHADAAPFLNETLPPALYAIVPPAPSWLHGNVAISRGYLDNACDGIVEVALTLGDGTRLEAAARICSGPPVLVPDSMFVRNLGDDLDQVIFGPDLPADEPRDVTRARAEDIVRRAYETVRFLNVSVMNGNVVQGRPALSLDTMPAEEAFDTERPIRPVFPEAVVDTQAILGLHQQVFTAIRGGAAPWFSRLLRRPNEVADYTDRGRRKMPALMCGADNSYLALTHRQIATIERAADPASAPPAAAEAAAPKLTPRNRSAQVHYEAAGNPVSSRPIFAIANCCPGLEVDFRAVWRRMFKGIVLREWDNLVVDLDPNVEDETVLQLKGHRLMRVGTTDVFTQMRGPSSSDPNGAVVLSSDDNPLAMAPLEWSNALARVLHEHTGEKVRCEFTAEELWEGQPTTLHNPDNIHVDLEVRPFFEEETAVISRTLAAPGELTQGLCSPWQNDYRECSCYYWASARPDFVNVENGPNGRSHGDNWLQKTRTGEYIPDDYADERLVLYDDLFEAWEEWLRFQVGGRDLPDEAEPHA